MIKNAQERTISPSKYELMVVLGAITRSMIKIIAAEKPETVILSFRVNSMLEDTITKVNKYL
jgi:hypothetical protein